MKGFNPKKFSLDLLSNKWVTITICGYEIAAILDPTDTLPTITHMHSRHKWVGISLLTALGVHFATAKDDKL